MTSRLVAGTVLALSLLAIVPAPTYRLWQGSVLITELGHGLAVASLAVAWLVRRRRGLALAWIAAALALGSPLARGWLFAREAGFDLHLAGLVVPPGSGCTGAEYRYARVGSWDGRLDLYCCSGYVTGDTPADT